MATQTVKQVDGNVTPLSVVAGRKRRAKVPELFGYYEACACLGVSRTNLNFVKDLPEPVAELKSGRIWLADEIREFAKVYELRRMARGGRTASGAS